MKLPKSVLLVVRGAGGVALAAALSAGCMTTATVAQKPTVATQAVVVASSQENTNQTAVSEVETDPEPEPTWTEEDMMAACGRG